MFLDTILINSIGNTIWLLVEWYSEMSSEKQNAILKRIKKKKKKHFKIDSTQCLTTCLNTKAYLSGTCKMRNEIELFDGLTTLKSMAEINKKKF
jgi:hypothetical protein